MLTIEQEPSRQTRCDCCDGRTTTLVRHVYNDGDAHAVYFAAFSDNHPDQVVSMLVALGEWGEGARPDTRRAFGLRLWLQGDNFQVGVVDADTLCWKSSETMGRQLARAEALSDPGINEVFHISDHVVVEDQEIVDYFQRLSRQPS